MRNVRFFGTCGIADGAHIVRLVAEDAAGNDGIVAAPDADGWHAADRHPQARAGQEDRALGEGPGLGRRVHERRGPEPLHRSLSDAAVDVRQRHAARHARHRRRVEGRHPRHGGRQRRQRVGRATRRASPRPAPRSAAGCTGSAAAACEIPFGRKAKLRGRLSLSTGGSLAGQTVVATSTVRKKGSRTVAAGSGITDRHGRYSISVPAGPSRSLPPGVRRRPRGARDRARPLGPRAGVEHDQGVTHPAVRRPRPLLRPPARPRRCPCPAVSSSCSRAARAGSGARSGRAHAQEGPLARLLPLQRTARELSDPAYGSAARPASRSSSATRAGSRSGWARGRTLRGRGLSLPMALARARVLSVAARACSAPRPRSARHL